MYYWKRWYFFFPKIWSYLLDGKWKMIFHKKNTRKYDISFKCSEKMVLSKGTSPGHDLSCIIWKDVFFFPKTYFFLGRKARGDLFQEMHRNMKFSVHRYGRYKRCAVPPVKRNQRWSYPAKIHQKVIGVLDWLTL